MLKPIEGCLRARHCLKGCICLNKDVRPDIEKEMEEEYNVIGKKFGAFPKIFALGEPRIYKIFDDDVEITEKVDGSQFGFGKINGELIVRSRRRELILTHPDKMFNMGIDFVVSIKDLIPDNTMFYGEYLTKPKHNTIAYGRVPKNNLALFGIVSKKYGWVVNHEALEGWAAKLGIDVVPRLFQGKVTNITDQIEKLMKTESFLGNSTIEGFVVKNYKKDYMIGDIYVGLMLGKFVSEEFKEKNHDKYNGEKSKVNLESFFQGFRTEARWEKAIQHLRDDGSLENLPKDIGFIIQEVQRDIMEEEKEFAMGFFWDLHRKSLMRVATAGFPEWYKNKLIEDMEK